MRELLVYEFDEEGARQRLAGLSGRIPREDDEQKIRVSPDELRQLIAATDLDRFRWMILTAILTTADRGPLLKTIPRHFNDAAGTLEIYDRKTKHRHRLVVLGSSARTILRLATGGLEDDQRVFPWTVWQVRSMWEAARDRAAGRPSRMQRRWAQKLPEPVGNEAAAFFDQEGVVTLPVLRFKDLRHLLPTALAALKVDRREIQAILGHAHGSRTSDSYITPAGDVTNLDAAAELLGLKDAHLARAG